MSGRRWGSPPSSRWRHGPDGKSHPFIPGWKSFPRFDQAVASADPNAFIDAAEDLSEGRKRIALNATSATGNLPQDCAWWLWPWEDVLGVVVEDPALLTDIRRWSGNPWLHVLNRPATRPTGWWVGIGWVHGATIQAAQAGIIGGLRWENAQGHDGARCLYGNGTVWNENNGFVVDQSPYAQLAWGERGSAVYSIHVNLLQASGVPWGAFAMSGFPTGNFTVSPSFEALHLALVIGNHTGSGVADELVVQPAHNFTPRSYPT